MKRILHLLTLLMLLVILAACGSGEAGEATPEPTAAPATQAPPTQAPEAIVTEEPEESAETPTAHCPVATDDTYLLRDPLHGFCLLYPTTHKVERPIAEEVALVVGSLLNSGDPRASINVTPLEGRMIDAVAGEIIAGFEGFEIESSETTVGGVPAILLDGVPGQDIHRRLIFANGDWLYQMYISPVDPANTGAIDSFMNGIVESFTFIPTSDTVMAADECVEPKADQQLVTSQDLDFCFLAPAGFTFEQPSATNANLFVDSMMNVDHPKLMFEVTDAAGLDTAAAAEELVASFEGFEIPRTFGQSLGYEPAERLDGVPGQDLGRVLLVVHDGRLYRLTFVPADPAQADVYAEMEALFTLVSNTFRFLP